MIARFGLSPFRQVLDNGVVVIVKASHATPAVTINASLQAGAVFDPSAHMGLANFVARTMDRGTNTRTADDIAMALESRGASLDVRINRHVVSVDCTCLVGDFGDMLGLVADVLMNPAFSPEQVALRRSEIVTALRQEQDDPAAMASEGLLRLLYPGHPYAKHPHGTVESVEVMPESALRAFHEARFVPGSLSLVIVGDVEPELAVALAADAFSCWKVAPLQTQQLPPVTKSVGRQRLVLPMMNKSQADIAYGFVTILRSDPAYYAYLLMNNVLGQYSMGGRLGESIRERQGMAYYAFSALDANVVRGPLVVRAGVNPSNVDRAVTSIDEELTRIAAEGPTERELSESKRYLVGAMPRTLETNAGIARFLQTAEFFELGLDHDQRLPDLVEGVTREDVYEASRASLVPSAAAVVIAGPYEDRG